MFVKPLVLALMLFCSGCALPAVLEGPGMALSVASMGQTAYTAYDAVSGQSRHKIAEMPRQYLNDRERMLVEMWEAGYYLVRVLHWEEEEMSPGERNRELARVAGLCGAEFSLVGRRFMRKAFKREEYAVYLTSSGELAVPPPAGKSGSGGRPQSYAVEMRESVVSYDIYNYSAYFFTTDPRVDGIWATKGVCLGERSPGARIVALRKSSPAKAAGLQPGDVIATVNGQPARPENLSALFIKGVNEVSFCRGDQQYARQVYQP